LELPGSDAAMASAASFDQQLVQSRAWLLPLFQVTIPNKRNHQFYCCDVTLLVCQSLISFWIVLPFLTFSLSISISIYLYLSFSGSCQPL
jgi:hypothetical protein